MGKDQAITQLQERCTDVHVFEDSAEAWVVRGNLAPEMMVRCIVGIPGHDRVVPLQITWKHWPYDYAPMRASAIKHLNREIGA